MISVLYVDDESALLEVTKDFMERGEGFKVDTAISAREAIEKLKAERYDALVADYLMPEMDGLELLRYLRPRCNGMPFILFTGKGGEEVAIEALNAGADFYVQKKGSPRTQFAELETKIRSAVARRQSELALRRSEENFRSLVEGLTDVIFTLNEEGIIAYINPGIRRFGHEPKDLIGRDFATLVSAEDIPAVARQLADVKQGLPVSFEFRMTDASGQPHSVRAACSPRTDHGRFIGGQGQITDVTETKNDDDQVHRRMDLHQVLFNLSPDVMLVIDPETGLPVECNDGACHQLGYTREEFMGYNLKEGEVADVPQKIREMIPEILQKGQATFETRHRTRDGGIRDMVVTARVFDDGTTKKIGAIVHDATEENEQKRIISGQVQRLHETFEQSPLAQLILFPDGHIISVNRAGADLLGCPVHDMTGRSVVEFMDNGEHARFSESLGELARSGSIHATRFSLAPRDGRKPVISLDGTVVKGSNGEICQHLVSLTDITGWERETAGLKELATTTGAVIAGAREGIFVCTPDLRITGWNPAMEDITGIAAPDALGQLPADLLPPLGETGEDSPAARALAGEIVATPDFRYEYPAAGKRGWARAIFSPLRDASGKITGIIGVVQEITARIKTLLRIKAANRLYAISAHVSATASVVHELEALLAETCRIAVDGDTVSMAWIGLFDHAAGILRPVAQAGTGGELPKGGYPINGPGEGGGLAGDAIRTGAPAISSDTETDPAAEPWRDDALRDGYRSESAIPFRLKGEIVGVLTLCSDEPFAFSGEEADVLTLLGSTLSSALDLLDKKTLQRRAGKGGHGSWERTRFLADGIESAAVPFAAVYADGSTGAVNAALCTLLGYTEDEVLSLPLTNLLDLPAHDGDRFQQVLATKKPDRFESSIRKKDGTCSPAELFLQAITDETSGQPCVGVFITDISDRKQRTDLLDRERLQYRTFFETCSAALMITTPEGTVLAANPAACRLFGQTVDALRSAGGGGLAGTGDPRFLELVRTCGEAGSADGELRFIRGDGTPVDAMVFATRFPDHDGSPALNLVLLDLTEYKKATKARIQEQDMAVAILDSLPNPVRRSDPSGEAIFFNRAWLAFTGRDKSDEKGDGWTEGIHPDDWNRYREAVRENETGRGTAGVEYRLRYNSGEYRWIREFRIPEPA
ncbi:MAG: PAS domain S-box protein, partial [Methanoregula sp.]